MAVLSVHIENSDENLLFIRVRDSDAPETEQYFFDRKVDCRCLEGTPVPEEHRLRAGALISAILQFPLPGQRCVFLIELVQSKDFGIWTAVGIVDGDTIRRHGVGATPVEALVDLLFNIQQR